MNFCQQRLHQNHTITSVTRYPYVASEAKYVHDFDAWLQLSHMSLMYQWLLQNGLAPSNFVRVNRAYGSADYHKQPLFLSSAMHVTCAFMMAQSAELCQKPTQMLKWGAVLRRASHGRHSKVHNAVICCKPRHLVCHDLCCIWDYLHLDEAD